MALTEREEKILKTFAVKDFFIDHHGEATVKETIADREAGLKGDMSEEEFMTWCENNVMPQTERENSPPLGYDSWDDWDAKEYARDRQASYPYIGDQLDKLYHDIENGTLDNSGEFFTAIQAVKTAIPKP